MLNFWIIAASLIGLALTFVIPPLLKKTTTTTHVERNALNIAIYQERLAELAQENLTPPQLAQAKLELEKTLSQELEEQAKLRQPTAHWISIIFIVVLIPLISIGGYLRLGQPQLIETKAIDTATDSQQASIEMMVTKLQERLAKNPDNLTDWDMLARTLTVLERFSEANDAFIKALTLGGDTDPEILISFAESLGKANAGELIGLPSLLLDKALQLEPDNQKALWIYGFAAMQTQQYLLAAQRWQRLLAQIPAEETNARQTLTSAIAEAQQLAQTPAMTDAMAEASTSTSTTMTEQITQIQVNVTLDTRLQAKLQPTDTVFIYAKAMQGPPMPLAVVKKLASELPLTVTLDDSMAMTPEMKLSSFKQVIVAARISRSGSAMTESGDLLGQIDAIDLEQTAAINITIDRVVP